MANPHADDPVLWCGPAITRAQIIERAHTWLTARVPFSHTAFHTTEHGTHRTDSSGYVSMAWGLPADLDIGGLAAIGFDVTKLELLAGDVLLRTDGSPSTRHVVIFERWADTDLQAYWGFEQSPVLGTAHRVIRYPYDEKTSKYRPYRYRNATR